MNFYKKLGEIRPNQLITTYGPGSIMDAVNDSLTVLDIEYWDTNNIGKEIRDARLASYMNVRRFFMPKTGGKEDIPVVSFPYYHVCSKGTCKFLFDMRDYFDLDQYKKNQGEVKCPKCGFPAYPSRFITVCEDGHMDDFPWRWWVHHGETSCKEDMYLKSTGNTSSLAELRVECNCGARRDMSGAMQKEKFAGLCCSGNHPHRPGAKTKICKKSVIPSQRGASNVHFTVTRNAISIPPWTNPINDIMGAQRATIEALVEAMGEEAGLSFAYQKYFGDKYSYEDFKAAYDRLSQNIKEFIELKEMEYAAITHHEDVEYQHDVKYFKAEEVALSESLKAYISRIIKIHRLREVRVLTGFTRLEAPEPEVDEQSHIVKLKCSSGEKWLPAVEINGEGVFIELNKGKINQWMQIETVKSRSDKYEECYAVYCQKKGWENFKPRNAEYVLLHTLSHMLIKEMSMQSGYSSSALHERIYSSENMCGILIYTGAADKEGSLGGLVELGGMNKFLPLLKGALENGLTCTTEEITDIISLCMKMYSSKKIEHAELVLTAPDSFRVKTLRTKDTMRNLIENTEKSLTITGYSISDYFTEMLDVIIKKSQQGVYVRLYVNDTEKQKEVLDRLMSYRSRFLQIYEYQKQEDDKMAALHAKLIVSDVKKSLVSSANLSYHGMQGNIEMGFLIESHDKAKQIEEVMKEMVRMKVCGKYK